MIKKCPLCVTGLVPKNEYYYSLAPLQPNGPYLVSHLSPEEMKKYEIEQNKTQKTKLRKQNIT